MTAPCLPSYRLYLRAPPSPCLCQHLTLFSFLIFARSQVEKLSHCCSNLQILNMTVSVCSGCFNRTPRTGRLISSRNFPQFQKLDVQDQGASMVGFWRGSSSGWQMAAFSLCPCMMETARKLPFISALSPFKRALPSSPNCLPKASLPNITLGFRIST